MKKVILIGGSPMVGKSTVSTLLASKLLYPCISTDDIGEALQTVSNINPMQDKNYLEYYSTSSNDKLINDIITYHNALEPAISRLINIHSTWSNPLIMEGWALYPKQIYSINNDEIFSVWLIAEDGLLENRIRKKPSFWQNADNPEMVVQNYLHRSEWHNKTILEQCKAGNQNYIMVYEHSDAETIVKDILEMMECENAHN